MCRSVDTMEADNFIYFCRLTTVYSDLWYYGTVVLWWYCSNVVRVPLREQTIRAV